MAGFDWSMWLSCALLVQLLMNEWEVEVRSGQAVSILYPSVWDYCIGSKVILFFSTGAVCGERMRGL